MWTVLSDPKVSAVMILLYTRATELPVFSPWSFFLVSDQEPWPYPGEGPRAWAFLSPPLAPVPLAFTAARTLGVCFLFPFSCPATVPPLPALLYVLHSLPLLAPQFLSAGLKIRSLWGT